VNFSGLGLGLLDGFAFNGAEQLDEFVDAFSLDPLPLAVPKIPNEMRTRELPLPAMSVNSAMEKGPE